MIYIHEVRIEFYKPMGVQNVVGQILVNEDSIPGTSFLLNSGRSPDLPPYFSAFPSLFGIRQWLMESVSVYSCGYSSGLSPDSLFIITGFPDLTP